MSPWLLALALVLFMEGAVIAIAPKQWQQTMRQITMLPAATLRRVGSTLVAMAFVIVLMMWWSQ